MRTKQKVIGILILAIIFMNTHNAQQLVEDSSIKNDAVWQKCYHQSPGYFTSQLLYQCEFNLEGLPLQDDQADLELIYTFCEARTCWRTDWCAGGVTTQARSYTGYQVKHLADQGYWAGYEYSKTTGNIIREICCYCTEQVSQNCIRKCFYLA